MHFRQSIHSVNICIQMENPNVLSTISWPCILANLPIVSILFSNGKSNRCFNTFFELDFRQAIHSVNLCFQMESLTVVSTICRPCILGNLSIASISYSNGKPKRSFNNFLAVHYSQSTHSFKLVFEWKI